jgi:small-conductance mechanosensitive channel
MEFLKLYIREEIASGIVILLFFILRYFTAKLIRRSARISQVLEHRTNLVIKYFNILIGLICTIAILVVSSLFAVIGVAMFAQWSILSNVTSGIILFFSAPFKIGDNIKIHDKEFPVEGEVDDIRGFHTYIKTAEGEVITYPNSLLLQKGISVVIPKTEHQEFTD